MLTASRCRKPATYGFCVLLLTVLLPAQHVLPLASSDEGNATSSLSVFVQEVRLRQFPFAVFVLSSEMLDFTQGGAAPLVKDPPTNVKRQHSSATIEDHALGAKASGWPWLKSLKSFASRDRRHRKTSTAFSATSALAVFLASLITIYLLLVCLRHLSRVSSVGESSRFLAGSPPNGDECSDNSGNGEGGDPGDQPATGPFLLATPPMPQEVQQLMASVLQLLAEPAALCASLLPHLRRKHARGLLHRLGLLAGIELSGFAFLPPGLQPLRAWVANQYVALGEGILGVSSLAPPAGTLSVMLTYIRSIGEPPDVRLTASVPFYARAMVAQYQLSLFSTFNVLHILNGLVASVSPLDGMVPDAVVSQACRTLEGLYNSRRWQILRRNITRYWLQVQQVRRAQQYFFDIILLREATGRGFSSMPEEMESLRAAIESAGGTAVSPFPLNEESTGLLGIEVEAAPESGVQKGSGPEGPDAEFSGLPASAPPHGSHGAFGVEGHTHSEPSGQTGPAPPQGTYYGPWNLLAHPYSGYTLPAGQHGAYGWTSLPLDHPHSEPSGHVGPAPPQGAYGEASTSGFTQPAPKMPAARTTAVTSSDSTAAAELASESPQTPSGTTEESDASAGGLGPNDDVDDGDDGDELLRLIAEAVDWSVLSDDEDGR
ncbi:hypothetical protein Efla_007200 [Eimeria flavescens]